MAVGCSGCGAELVPGAKFCAQCGTPVPGAPAPTPAAPASQLTGARSLAVENAVPEIKAIARVCLTRTGGRGAAREFAELLLRARGEWDEIVERYVVERSTPTLEVLR